MFHLSGHPMRLVALPGLVLCLSLSLVSCSTTSQTTPSSNANSDLVIDSKEELAQTTPTQGQSLPITAQTMINGEQIELEVAETTQQQATGLMFRDEVPPNRGMLFPFEPARPVRFWMRNVSIDLDMVFLRDGQVIAIAADVPPCTTPECPVYGPAEPVDYVLELAGGRAAELGLAVGDTVVIEPIAAP